MHQTKTLFLLSIAHDTFPTKDEENRQSENENISLKILSKESTKQSENVKDVTKTLDEPKTPHKLLKSPKSRNILQDGVSEILESPVVKSNSLTSNDSLLNPPIEALTVNANTSSKDWNDTNQKYVVPLSVNIPIAKPTTIPLVGEAPNLLPGIGIEDNTTNCHGVEDSNLNR